MKIDEGNSVLVRYFGAEDELPPALATHLGEYRVVGFDVETGGPDPLSPTTPGFEVRIIGFAVDSAVWVLDGRHAETIREILTTNSITFVAFNAAFDCRAVKAAYGVTPANVIDPMQLAKLVYPADTAEAEDDFEIEMDERHALKPLSVITGSRALLDAEDALHAHFTELLGDRPPGSERAAGVRKWLGEGFSRVERSQRAYGVYNGLDALFGVRVLRKLLGEWTGEPDDIRRLGSCESRLALLTAGAGWRGQRIDRAAMRQVYHLGRADRDALKPSFGPLGVSNPDSPKQVSEALVELGAVKPRISKDSGLISTDKKFGLPRLMEPDQPEQVQEAARLLKEWRGHTALVRKVREIDRLLAKSGDGRLHPDFNTQQAKTGRMSISNPALQNLPKKDKRIRSIFIAEPGMALVSADFAQVEYRVAAALSRDQAMIEIINTGANLHVSTAASIFGEAFSSEPEDSPKYLELYGYAKNCGFLTLYGGGPANLVATSGGALSLSKAESILAKFHQTYPDLKRWSNKVNRETTVVSLSGRRIAVDRDRTYANTNYHVQSAARDVFADALLKLRAAGWGDYLWLVIHDEIILQVPVALVDAAKQALESAMRMMFFGVLITADAELRGDRWMPLPDAVPVAA